MLTEPASAMPGDSGVGVWRTSIRAMLLSEIWSSRTLRLVLDPEAPARSKPPTEIGTLPAGTPFIENWRASPPATLIFMPGRYLKNSPTLPSPFAPNSSAETTFFMLGAKRCSLIAIAAPDISFDVATTNSLSFTTSPARPGSLRRAPASRLKSRCAVVPPVTTIDSVCTSSPVKKTRTRAGPEGTLVRRYCPLASVKVSSPVPSTVTRARSTYSPLRTLSTRPSTMPVARDWA